MLSRIAESLFWIGRYIERAEGTARLLDVHLQMVVEDPWVEEETACATLLSIMGCGEEEQPNRASVVRLLAYDEASPWSIARGSSPAKACWCMRLRAASVWPRSRSPVRSVRT